MHLIKLRLIQKKRDLIEDLLFFDDKEIQIQIKCYGGLIMVFLDEIFQLIDGLTLSKY